MSAYRIDFQRLPSTLYGMARVLTGSLSYDAATRMFRDGRLSERELEIYTLLWIWSAPRMGDVANAGMRQFQYAKRRGWSALQTRFDRYPWLVNRLACRYLGPYLIEQPKPDVPVAETGAPAGQLS